MVGQLVADMFMQVFIELERRISQQIGYASNICLEVVNYSNPSIRMARWLGRYKARKLRTSTSFLNTIRMVFLSN